MSNISSGKNQNGGSFPEAPLTGIMNASNEVLRAAVERYETFAHWSARVLLAGLAWEVLLTLFPTADPESARWNGVIATALVGLGVYGEVKFHRMAAVRQGVLLERSDKLLGEAVERAANAEQETERIRAQFGHRRLTPMQSMSLHGEFCRSPGPVEVLYPVSDLEAEAYATEFARLLAAAGWAVDLTGAQFTSLLYGLHAPVTAIAPGPSNALRAALTAAGITFDNGSSSVFGMSQTRPRGQKPLFTQAPAKLYVFPRPPAFAG